MNIARGPAIRWIVFAFATVAAAFLASTAYAVVELAHVEEEARQVAADALPRAQREVLATRVDRERVRSMRIATLLECGCAALSVAAALVVARTVQRHARLADEHARLLESRAQELEQFAGRVAHDVVSPLSAAVLAIDHLKRATAAGPAGPDVAVQRSLTRGRSALGRVQTLVEGLLEFARSGARPTPNARASLDEIAEEVVDAFRPTADAAKVALSVRVTKPCEIACSRGVATSIVTNLVRNAIAHMGDSEERRVDVVVEEHGAAARLEVRDTGPGVPDALHEAIFEPYVRGPRAHGAGIGLGLATVKRLANAHGKDVVVRKTPGGGATFSVDLPLAR